MQLKNDDVFTRPVIKEISDDFSTTFKIEFKVETTRETLELTYKCELRSEVFKNYCKEKKVAVGLHIYSKSILFRKFVTIQLENLDGVITLNRGDVYGKLEISPILVASTDLIINASSELLDKDDSNYSVKKGMILGYAETVELEVDYSLTNLNDLVVIKPTQNKEESNMIEINSEQIIYTLYSEEYNSYEEIYQLEDFFAKKLIKIIHNAIYTRLLYYVLEIQENGEDNDFYESSVFTFIKQSFESKYPDSSIYDITSDLINKYAIELADISFVNITVESEYDDE